MYMNIYIDTFYMYICMCVCICVRMNYLTQISADLLGWCSTQPMQDVKTWKLGRWNYEVLAYRKFEFQPKSF